MVKAFKVVLPLLATRNCCPLTVCKALSVVHPDWITPPYLAPSSESGRHRL